MISPKCKLYFFLKKACTFYVGSVSLPFGHVFWEGSSRAFRKCAEPGNPEVTWFSGQATVAFFAFVTLAVIGTVYVTGLWMKPLEASGLDSVHLILILVVSPSLPRAFVLAIVR